MITAGILLLGLAAPPPAPAAELAGVESARFRFPAPDSWREVAAVEDAGYRVVLSTSDGTTLEARVEVDGRPLADDSRFPPDRAALPAEARALLEAARGADPGAETLALALTRGAGGVLEAVERVITFTSRRIRYEAPGGTASAETAASCRRLGRGSCVGRSLLAADLLLRAGIPARQVTGVLTAREAKELGPESRPLFSEALGGVRHRWIEVFVPSLGWVPSDPGGLANAVTARHLALRTVPRPGFEVDTLARTRELRWPALESAPGTAGGVVLARPRERIR